MHQLVVVGGRTGEKQHPKNQLRINPPKRETPDGRLDAKQWGQLRELRGSIGYSELNALIRTPEWSDLSREEKQKEVGQIMGDATKTARNALAGY